MVRSPTSAPQPRDPEATRTAILQAAQRLFAQKGFADTAISEIAREAGVTQSLIHHHFGAKSDLWKAVRQHFTEQFTAAQLHHLSEPQAQQGEQLLRRMAMERFRFMKAHPDILRMFTWRTLEGNDVLTEQDCRDLDGFRQSIAALQRSGVIRVDVKPEYIMIGLNGLLMHWLQSRHLLISWLKREEELERMDEEYLEGALKLFFEGLVAR
jgi:TetR/AcrR family transcriptional regulator